MARSQACHRGDRDMQRSRQLNGGFDVCGTATAQGADRAPPLFSLRRERPVNASTEPRDLHRAGYEFPACLRNILSAFPYPVLDSL